MWILLFALFAPFTPAIDMFVSGMCYSPEHGFCDHSFFRFLFKYGEIFGIVTGAITSFIFLFSCFQSKWKKWRRGCCAMVLTLVIGAGLITNVILKGHWGRPRPKQVIEFGGHNCYRPFWHPNLNVKNNPQKSFPSGHVAMGCYFFCLCLIGKRYRSKTLFRTGLVLTIFLGGGLMITRVVQGGHFVSDVIASAIIMWYISKASVWLTWVGSERQAFFPKSHDTY